MLTDQNIERLIRTGSDEALAGPYRAWVNGTGILLEPQQVRDIVQNDDAIHQRLIQMLEALDEQGVP